MVRAQPGDRVCQEEVFGPIAVVIVSREPRNPIPWLLLFFAAAMQLLALSLLYDAHRTAVELGSDACEFACQIAGAKVVLVMGHTSCGAIKGAIDSTSILSIFGECSGNVRSTPTPKDCLRTVKVSRTPEP